jgi:hypothetical protein
MVLIAVIWSGQVSVAASKECGIEPLGRAFPDWLSK